jgi:hypothetical protein
VLLVPSVIGAGRAAFVCKMFGGGPDAPAAPPAPGPAGYARREDQTYLTLPEWYIVYSADEYAAYLAQHRPSGFPYFQAVGQFWDSYDDVCTITRDRYPFNSDYHLTLVVIGTSFTAENVFKGLWENTIGRVSEWTSNGTPTPEEAYAQQVAAEYGTFIHTIPWYEFPFSEKLSGLWKLDVGGPNLVRRVERRVALSLEYGVKAGYGWLIGRGTASVYAPEDLTILARAGGVTPELLDREPQVHVVEVTPGQSPLVSLPRYEAFTLLAPKLMEQGVRFSEIAGNDEIMVTVLAPRDWRPTSGPAETLFTMPILTQPGRARVALRVPVRELHTVVGDLTQLSASSGVTIEHIYDY